MGLLRKHGYALLLFILVIKVLVPSAYRAAISPSGLVGIDNRQYYDAAVRLSQGENLYVSDTLYQHPYPYTPLLAVVYRSLVRFTPQEAFHIWAAISVACVTCAPLLFILSSRRLLSLGAILAPLFLIMAFRFWPTVIQLAIGNVDAVVLLLLSGMYLADRFRVWFVFAGLVAAAAMIKFWMIAAIFYLLIRRQWRAAAASVVLAFTFLGTLFTIVGWHEWVPFFRTLHLYSNQPDLVSHSILGMARLFLANNPLGVTPLFDRPIIYVSFVTIAYAILVTGLIFVLRRSRSRPGSHEARLELGFTVASILLGLTVCHQYYFLLVLPLIWTLLTPGETSKARSRMAGVCAAVVGYVVFASPSPGLVPVPLEFTKGLRSLSLGTCFVATVVLWLMTVWCLRCAYQQEPVESRIPDGPAAA